MSTVMNNKAFADKALDIAKNYKTLYVRGCFGAPMTDTNKKRYCNKNNESRFSKIMAASADTFGFDCVCLIKGILWGWSGSLTEKYGGAEYTSNGVPDFGTESAMKRCTESSTDFSKIELGEVLWKEGHVGIYVGNGLAVESTPTWKGNVQITCVSNIGSVSGYNKRKWTKHGKLSYIDYSYHDEPISESGPETDQNEIIYIVVEGDTLWSIAKRYGTTYQKLADYNGISNPNIIRVGQKIRIPVPDDVKEPAKKKKTYKVVEGDTLWGIARKLLGSGTRYVEIKELNGLTSNSIRVGQILEIPD